MQGLAAIDDWNFGAEENMGIAIGLVLVRFGLLNKLLEIKLKLEYLKCMDAHAEGCKQVPWAKPSSHFFIFKIGFQKKMLKGLIHFNPNPIVQKKGEVAKCLCSR